MIQGLEEMEAELAPPATQPEPALDYVTLARGHNKRIHKKR